MNKKLIYQEMYEKEVFIQPYLYYYLTYDICPSRLAICKIDKNKLYDLLVKNFTLPENKIIKSQAFNHEKNELWHSFILFDLGNHCMVFFNSNWGCYSGAKMVEIIYSYRTDHGLLKKVEDLVKQCIILEATDSEINLICKNDTLHLTSFDIPN